MRTVSENDVDHVCEINAPCFRILMPEEIELVRTSKTQLMFRKDEILAKQGAFASYMLFVLSGLVKQYLESEIKRNFNLRIIKPGEFVGLSAVFNKNRFGFSAAALTDCQAILVENEVISNLIRRNGDFGFNLVAKHCERYDDVLASLHKVMYKQMNGRLAESLLYINSFKKENTGIFQLLSRKDIADFAGISTENTIRLLKNLHKEGLIEMHDKDIVIVDLDSLSEISRKG